MAIEIPVSANVSSVKKGVQDLQKTIQNANKTKWSPVDLQAIAADVKKAERLINDFRWRTGTMPASGRKYGPMPEGPAPASDRDEEPAASGTRGRKRERRPASGPAFSDVGRNFFSGVGGGFNSIAGYGGRGAIAGGQNGGFGGGAMGMLKGLGIGTLAFGAFKAGQAAVEGYDLAKERSVTLDSLKRQMGDLGVHFEKLKYASEGASDGLMLNSKETAKLMEEFNKLSHGAERTEAGLMQQVNDAGGFGRAYGMDPSQSVGFFAGMKNLDTKQNNRELALMIAEGVNHSGGRADDMMQAIQSFASATSRLSLAMPNLNAYAGAYSEMIGNRTPGLTSEVSASLLSQANSSVMRMGGAGEAGQAFILAALNRNGRLNPVQAMAQAQGGLFGTRRGTFDGEGEIGRYMGGNLDRLMGGSPDKTNFESIRDHIKSMGGNKWLQLEGAQRLFGVSSLSNAAALMNLSGNQAGGLQQSLTRSGIDINSINPKGIQTLAGIGASISKDELNAILRDMKGRRGSGALTGDEAAQLDKASGGTLEEFKDAMLKVAASKDQAETDATKMLTGIAHLESTQISIGDRMIAPLNTIRDIMTLKAFGSPREMKAKIHEMNVKGINQDAEDEIDSLNDTYKAKKDAAWYKYDHAKGTGIFHTKAEMDAVMQELRAAQAENHPKFKDINDRRATRLRQLAEEERIAAGGSMDSADGSITSLPTGATASRAGGKEMVEVHAKVSVQSTGADGRVVSERSGSTRVSHPRGTGQSSAVVDVR